MPDLVAMLAVLALPVGSLVHALLEKASNPFYDNPTTDALLTTLWGATMACWLPAAWVWLRGLAPVARVCSPDFRADIALTRCSARELWRTETTARLWWAMLPMITFVIVALAPGLLIWPSEGYSLSWNIDFLFVKFGVGVVATMASLVAMARIALMGLAVVCCRRSRPLGMVGFMLAGLLPFVALPIAATIMGTALFFVDGLAQTIVQQLGWGWNGCCPSTTFGDLVTSSVCYAGLLGGLAYCALAPTLALRSALESNLFRFDADGVDSQPHPVCPPRTQTQGLLWNTTGWIQALATWSLVAVMVVSTARTCLDRPNKLTEEFATWLALATVGLILLAGVEWRRHIHAPAILRLPPARALTAWARRAWPITLPLVVGVTLHPTLLVLSMAIDLRPWVWPSSDDLYWIWLLTGVEILLLLVCALISLGDSIIWGRFDAGIASGRWYRPPMVVMMPMGGCMVMAIVLAPDMAITSNLLPDGLIPFSFPRLWPFAMGLAALALAAILWLVARRWAVEWRARQALLAPAPEPPPPYPEFAHIRRFAPMPDHA